jgi:hypothetical protein
VFIEALTGEVRVAFDNINNNGTPGNDIAVL